MARVRNFRPGRELWPIRAPRRFFILIFVYLSEISEIEGTKDRVERDFYFLRLTFCASFALTPREIRSEQETTQKVEPQKGRFDFPTVPHRPGGSRGRQHRGHGTWHTRGYSPR
jgi:hypothetical protein